ncbi:hypothetical protein [Streptomyces sp. AK010]|uniref:hypothetical protein n=1 Tax=Streptomyces sp. AK010 TaxID=2723074 RepID=UPI001613F778|nr:hypothetical protein [Streptomyces sp. AK010]MBB6421953.1 hypothetical protein [Streptomyces sp. AK010]
MGTQSATTNESAETPIALDAVDESVETALAVGLAMPERSVIDATTRDLIGHLRVLMAEDLGFDVDPAVQALFREGYRVLDLTRRPSAESTQFSAYQYMREVGLLTRRFADVYRETQVKEEADG